MQKLDSDQVIALVTEGRTQAEVAKLLGVTQAAVSWRIKQAGLGSPQPIRKLDPAEVWKLYESGLGQWSIAKRLGVGIGTINKLMRNCRMPLRPVKVRQPRGYAHPLFKGDAGSYQAGHQRLTRLKGQPQNCVKCGSKSDPKTRYHWANLTGEYLNPGDYVRLCTKCHAKLDRGANLPLEKILEFRTLGWSQEKIAQRFSVSRTTISRLLRENGLRGWLSAYSDDAYRTQRSYGSRHKAAPPSKVLDIGE